MKRGLRAAGVLAAGGLLALMTVLVFGGLVQPEPAGVAVPLEGVSSLRLMDLPTAYAAAPTQMSYLWTTGGAGDGASTYTRADWSNIAKIIASCPGDTGVGDGALNELNGTAGTNKVTMDTGYALVDGKPFITTVAGDLTIPSAVGGGNTRIDRIVARADWTLQTVRLRVITGTDAASPVAPAIVQTAGTTYDIYLWEALVNTSGAVTVTDERTWCATALAGRGLSAETDGQIGIATGAITSTLILNGTVDTVDLADNAVDDEKAGDRVPQFYRRQGGSATNWSSDGTTTYTPTSVRMQGGTFTSGASGATTVTFPTAFSNVPIVILTPKSAIGVHFVADATVISSSAFTSVVVNMADTGVSSVDVYWLAIGPE